MRRGTTLFLLLLFHPTLIIMAPSATFCDLPLSTTFCSDLEKSVLSLDWVLASGLRTTASTTSGTLCLPCDDSVCSMTVQLAITTSLPFDLVLGRDWLLFCRDSLPSSRFVLSSGVLDLCPAPPGASYISFFLFSGSFNVPPSILPSPLR